VIRRKSQLSQKRKSITGARNPEACEEAHESSGGMMVYIPLEAKWYIAEIVEEIRVEGDERNVVHKNLVLIRADSPDQAYQRSLEIGQRSESTFQNPDGKSVTSHFRGLSYLNVISEALEDGTELLYERKIAIGEDEIRKWVRQRGELELFEDRKDVIDLPNYSSKDVVDDAIKLVDRESEPRT
jgi:hypothetical protein